MPARVGVDLGDREHLDGDAGAPGHLRGEVEGLVAAGALDHVDPADPLFRLRERPVGDDGLFARPHDRGLPAQRLSEDVGAGLAEHRREGDVLVDDRAALLRAHRSLDFAVSVDQEQESHVSPPQSVPVRRMWGRTIDVCSGGS